MSNGKDFALGVVYDDEALQHEASRSQSTNHVADKALQLEKAAADSEQNSEERAITAEAVGDGVQLLLDLHAGRKFGDLFGGDEPAEDRTTDSDADGITDWVERHQTGTDPHASDSDNDGSSDAAELDARTNPWLEDTDGDGLFDGSEERWGTDPLAGDTDGDGLQDGFEVRIVRTNPLSGDTDGDGLGDLAEVQVHRTDARKADTDGDGLADGTELEEGLNPRSADTDSDGVGDLQEARSAWTMLEPTSNMSDFQGVDAAIIVAEGTVPPVAPPPVDTSEAIARDVGFTTPPWDPDDIDFSGDEMGDSDEVRLGRDPLAADTLVADTMAPPEGAPNTGDGAVPIAPGVEETGIIIVGGSPVDTNSDFDATIAIDVSRLDVSVLDAISETDSPAWVDPLPEPLAEPDSGFADLTTTGIAIDTSLAISALDDNPLDVPIDTITTSDPSGASSFSDISFLDTSFDA